MNLPEPDRDLTPSEQAERAFRATWPDARTHENHRRLRWGPLGPCWEIYCVNCGRTGGLVTISSTFVFYVCKACEKFGELPLPKVPEQAVRPVVT